MATRGEKDVIRKRQRRIRFTDVPTRSLEPDGYISGFANEPLVSLEKAVEPLLGILPHVKSQVEEAKQKCTKPADNLTPDESASIMLYTMDYKPQESSVYSELNKTLRSSDRQQKLKPWYLYMRLFLNALFRLPPRQVIVYRGIKLAMTQEYSEGASPVWWAFSSCSAVIGTLDAELFLGEVGARTMFHIRCQTARDIRKHSYFENEDEMLLLAGTKFKVVSNLKQGDLNIVQMDEIPSSPPKLEPVEVIFAQPRKLNTTAILPNIPSNIRWEEKGVTIAGGYDEGDAINQISKPGGIYIDKDQSAYIADWNNHRIMQWKPNAFNGQVVAGGNGRGNGANQLNRPTDVTIDQNTDSLIICDYANQRVVRWPRRNGPTKGEIILRNIACWGAQIDDQRRLYISDPDKNEVRRYRPGEMTGTLVAGGNGEGDRLNQLNWPTHIFVDREYSIYVSDSNNHRIVKWMNGAKEGIVMAGGNGEGSALNQLSSPRGIYVDSSGTIYVADEANHRVIRWRKGATKGEIIAGRNTEGAEDNQLSGPDGLAFDLYGNLYVVDSNNNRVQKFFIEIN